MKFQLLLATFIVYSVSLAPAQEQGIQHHVTPESDEAGRGGSEFTIHNSDEARPLYLQPLDPTAADFGIEAKISRSRNEKGSAASHYEKGMLYKRAGNYLYNQSRYKQAYRFYQQAEAELQQAADLSRRSLEAEEEKLRNAAPTDANLTLSDSPFAIQLRQAVAAYYHLGLVCEKIRNDKSIAAECFAKARELDPGANHLALKLTRTKEGRARLGIKNAKDFKRITGPKENRDTIGEGAEEQPAFKDENGK